MLCLLLVGCSAFSAALLHIPLYSLPTSLYLQVLEGSVGTVNSLACHPTTEALMASTGGVFVCVCVCVCVHVFVQCSLQAGQYIIGLGHRSRCTPQMQTHTLPTDTHITHQCKESWSPNKHSTSPVVSAGVLDLNPLHSRTHTMGHSLIAISRLCNESYSMTGW